LQWQRKTGAIVVLFPSETSPSITTLTSTSQSCPKLSTPRQSKRAGSANNAQGELYLTDIIAMAAKDGKTIASVIAKNDSEVAGVNDKVQLAELERVAQHLHLFAQQSPEFDYPYA
jgi:hypothetical protein